MPTVLLAGVPEKWMRRAKPIALAISEMGRWNFQFFPCPAGHPEIGATQVNQLLERAIDLDGPHIIGFQQTDNRASIAGQIRQHFRFRWGDAAILKTVGAGPEQFRAHLEGILEEEDRWREHIMPQDKSSPLILPANVFSKIQKHEDIWGQSEMYGREPDHFERLARKIKHFEQEHLKAYTNGATFMVDRSGLVWKDAGPYHATTPFPRRWKYSRLLVDKFHYDVEHEKGAAFIITDSAKKVISVKANKHANIDCHGYKSH